MHQLSPNLIIESVNRMVVDLFRAAEMQSAGLSGVASTIRTKIPRELGSLGVGDDTISQIARNATAIVDGAERDLTDERLRAFCEENHD